MELRQEAVKACLAEFSGFVEGIGPSVEYSSQTDAYELVDIQSLECLKNALLWLDQSPELPCSSEEIQRVYAEKRAKLSSQLVNDFPPEWYRCDDFFAFCFCIIQCQFPTIVIVRW